MADTPLSPPAQRHRWLPPAFAALSEGNFRRYWLGLIAYVLGWRCEFVSYTWMVWELTQDPLYLGLFGLTEGVPLVLCQLFGGVLADRVQRVRLLIGTQLVTTTTLTIALVLTATGLLRVEHIFALTIVSAMFRAFEQPTRMALVPDLVSRERMANAIAIGSVPWQTGRILGPSVAGLLIAIYGAPTGFAMGVAAYATAIVLYSGLHVPELRRMSRTDGVLRNLAEGLTFVGRNWLFMSLLTLTFVDSVFGMAYITMLPVYADRYFDVGSGGYGLMQSVSGVGAILGTLTLASLVHRLQRRGTILLVFGATFGIGVIGLSQAPSLPTAALMLVLMGVANTFYLTLTSIVLQEQVPNELRGRVMGIYGLAFNFIPIGGLLAGALAAAVDARFAVLVGGVAVTSAALLMLTFGRRLRAVQ
jgi:MFS family permease